MFSCLATTIIVTTIIATTIIATTIIATNIINFKYYYYYYYHCFILVPWYHGPLFNISYLEFNFHISIFQPQLYFNMPKYMGFKKRARQSEPARGEPEPDPAIQVVVLRSELAALRALFERAGHPDTAHDLLRDLKEAFGVTRCRYRCPVTSQWLWRGYLSRDNTLAAKICQATLCEARSVGAVPISRADMLDLLSFMQQLRETNSCKEATALFE